MHQGLTGRESLGSKSGKRSQWSQRAGLVVGSTIFSLLLVEVVLRIVGIAPERWTHPNRLEREDKRVGLDAYPDDPQGYFDIDLRQPAERARWRAKGLSGVDRIAEATPWAVGFEYEEHLCRSDPIGPLDPEVTRVVLVGDSFTEGQGVRREDTFAALLDRGLDGPVEVINCGRRGHDFPEIHRFFDRILALEPDVVVYVMTLNDPVRSAEFQGRQQYLDDWIMDRRRMYSEARPRAPSFWKSRLWALVSDRVEGFRVGRATERWYIEMYGEPNREGWAMTQEHVVRMQESMESRDGEFLVVLLPLLVDLSGNSPFTQLSRTIERALAQQGRGIHFHDVTPALRGQRDEELWVHPADRHPNARAHALIAAELGGPVQVLVDRQRGHR